MVKKCEWQKKLKEMEETERFYNKLFHGEDRPDYEEDMDLDYWRRKKQLRERTRK